MCYYPRVQERDEQERHPAPQSDLAKDEAESPVDPRLPEGRDRIPQLTRAVQQLLDALDRCAGDPPDCPHCGPARSFALGLLNPNPTEQTQNLQPGTEQERLSLMGRVGAEPAFRTTPKGTLVARFPLAVHNPDNSTTWHQVLAFNQQAEKLKESVTKGEAVQVVGYMHTREGRGRDGQPRTIRELYAATVTRRAQ